MTRSHVLDDAHRAAKVIYDLYAAIDAGDPDAAARSFTPDGVFATSLRRSEGRDEIHAFLTERAADPGHRTLHVVANLRPSRIDADGAEFEGVLMLYVPQPAADPPCWTMVRAVPATHVLHRDDDDGWLVARRDSAIPLALS